MSPKRADIADKVALSEVGGLHAATIVRMQRRAHHRLQLLESFAASNPAPTPHPH
jgi:hypothetical protein